MKKLTLAFALVAGVSMLSCAPGTPKLGKASLDKVIAAMTPEEKVHLLIGTGMEGFSAGDSAVVGETKNLVPGAAGTTYPIPRLGIPSVVLADGPAGLRISRHERATMPLIIVHISLSELCLPAHGTLIS